VSLEKALRAMFDVMAKEAARNEEFRRGLEAALIQALPADRPPPAPRALRAKRAPAVFDPVEVARQGEEVLRGELGKLDLEQLRAIVSQYGMDPSKLVMKWKRADRVAEHIVELAMERARKGEAFLAG